MNDSAFRRQLALAQEMIASLQDELAETNKGLLALTLELEQRVDHRTAELQSAQGELERTNSDLLQLTLELEDRVARRTAQLEAKNEELTKLWQQHVQATKLSTMGELAASIAHDFNNLLTIILGFSESLLSRVDDESSREMLQEIHKAGDRAATLIGQLLAFSRKSIVVPRSINLSTVARDMEKMLARLVGEDVEISIDAQPRLGRIFADRSQLEQVLLNLVVNARDAMPQGGIVSLSTRNVTLDRAYEQGHVEVEPGSYVMLSVSDNGCGMSDETKAHLFEPFFTTKEVGKGTGLGLATVYGIVKQSGGHIFVYSEPNQGTSFKMYFPRLESPDEAAAEEPADESNPCGTETILVVEDQEGIRRLARLTLESCGYTVLDASLGIEALGLAQSYPRDIDVVVTDVVMPKMNGREVAAALRESRPEMKVLFMSGYTDDAIVRYGIEQTTTAFLQKPFTPTALARKVREVLDGPAPPIAPRCNTACVGQAVPDAMDGMDSMDEMDAMDNRARQSVPDDS